MVELVLSMPELIEGIPALSSEPLRSMIWRLGIETLARKLMNREGFSFAIRNFELTVGLFGDLAAF